MAAVEIRKLGDESKDSEDEDTSEEEEDTSEDEETSEEDDDSDGKEPSRITLHSESTHRAGGASTDASNGSYRPCRPSGPRQSSEEPATTTEGQGQEHDGTKSGKAQERGNQTLEMNTEQVFGAEDEEPQSSLGSNTVYLSQPPPEHIDIDIGAREESVAEGQHSEHTQGETHVPTIAVEPHLEVLGRTAAAPSTDSSSLSFRWAMEDPVYTERGMAITMMWRECGTAVQEKMANTLLSKWPRSSRELQTTIVCPLQQWTPWFPRQSTM
jgi:hypothetical protein